MFGAGAISRLLGRVTWGIGLGLVGGGMLGLSAGAAGAEILDCRLRYGHGAEGLIAPQYLFDHEDEALVAEVYDGLIHARLRHPQIARVRQEATRLVISWSVPVKDRWGEPMTAEFRAELSFDDGSLRVEALLSGEVVAEGEGLCAAPQS